MTIHWSARKTGHIDWRTITQAAVAYTLGVFVIAFSVGTIRVLLVAPRLGALIAVILEAPIVLAVSWGVSLWCIRRFNVSRIFHTRILMGVIAFAILMLLEIGVSAWVFGETVEHYLTKFGTAPGAVGLAMQICFALIPWAQCTLRSRISGT